tara:strand:+ start:1628 stop:2464 length:837 start_codon:yes stop_codon:yes gene_type:complete
MGYFDDIIDNAEYPVGREAPSVAPVKGVVENCPKCRGTGRFTSYSGRSLGQCFTCKGKGTQTFVNPAPVRAANRQKIADRGARMELTNWAEFAEQNPEAAAWIIANPNFEFATAMGVAVRKYGILTEKQMAAITRGVERDAARKAAAVARVETAAVVDTSLIEAAFAKAATTLGKPVLRLSGFKISRAPAGGKNPGALYIKSNEGTYLGMVKEGKFLPSRDCGDAMKADILAVFADPQGAAIAYGRLTGSCSCCGRELTNGVSIERGIGPICAEKFGW